MKTNGSQKRKNFALGFGRGEFGPHRSQLQIPCEWDHSPEVISPNSFLPPITGIFKCLQVTSTAGGLSLRTLALWGLPRPSRIPGAQLRHRASGSRKAATCWRPQARAVPACWFGGGESRAARPEEGSSRAPGRAFVALKTFQRACHGDAQRPGGTHAACASRGELFGLLGAVSLLLSDAPPPGLALCELPPSRRGPAPRRRRAVRSLSPAPAPRLEEPLSPAAPRRPCPSRRLSKWPGPVPRPDGRRARHLQEGRRGPATRGPEAAWSGLFANGPKRDVQVASHSGGGGGGGAGAPDGTAGERGARGGARGGRTGSLSAAPSPSFVSRRGADLASRPGPLAPAWVAAATSSFPPSPAATRSPLLASVSLPPARLALALLRLPFFFFPCF